MTTTQRIFPRSIKAPKKQLGTPSIVALLRGMEPVRIKEATKIERVGELATVVYGKALARKRVLASGTPEYQIVTACMQVALDARKPGIRSQVEQRLTALQAASAKLKAITTAA